MYIGSHVKRMQKEMPSFTIEFCQLLFFFLSGTVKVWDPRQKDDPVANMEPVQGENKRDCWTVAFGKLPKDSYT